MICRAKGCHREAMPNGNLCGACDEANEEHPLTLKPGPGRVSSETVAKRSATRRKRIEERDARRAAIREGLGLDKPGEAA